MELYYVVTILNRNMRELQERIYRDLGLTVGLTMMGRGTASRELLTERGLIPTEKAVMATVADRETARKLFYETKNRLYIDIPGNGIMMSIPVKSVGGSTALSYLTGGKQAEKGMPEMNFAYELIYVILNEGHSDEVMDAALPAGAGGGTLMTAKGTGIRQPEKFRGLSLTNEKEIALIVARSSAKADIMKAITEKAGPDTAAGAICFSLPITQVAGLRRLEEDE